MYKSKRKSDLNDSRNESWWFDTYPRLSNEGRIDSAIQSQTTIDDFFKYSIFNVDVVIISCIQGKPNFKKLRLTHKLGQKKIQRNM